MTPKPKSLYNNTNLTNPREDQISAGVSHRDIETNARSMLVNYISTCFRLNFNMKRLSMIHIQNDVS